MRIHPKNESPRPREINLTLSDFEVSMLFKEAVSRGTTIENILEDFIGNLTDGYHYRGSDESRLASEYLDRVIYSMDDDESFLQWLANYKDLEDLEVRFELIEENKGLDNEIARDEVEFQESIIEDLYLDYIDHIGAERAKTLNHDEEIQNVEKFFDRRKALQR